MDVLTVKGVHPRIDGDYNCDVVGLVNVSSAEAFTVREAQFVRDFSGARGNEIVEAFLAGDISVQAAIAMVILKRNGKPLLTEKVLDLSAGWAVFHLEKSKSDDEVEAVDDPPTSEGETTPSTNGGTSSARPSENQDDDPSPTGHLRSATPTSGQDLPLATSAT